MLHKEVLNRNAVRMARLCVVVVVLVWGLTSSLYAARKSLERLPGRSVPFVGGSWLTGDARDFGYDATRLDWAIDLIGQQEGVYSVLVVRNSRLVAERYFREASRTKAHNLKSSSKSIISALVGLLVDEGRLSLDDSVVERLSVRGLSADRTAITVRDLLRMASGLTSTSYASYGAWIASSDWVKSALALPLLHPPGTQYRYSTGNTHMLSALVRQASGQSTRAFAEQRLFNPLGIEVLGWETDPKGIHIGGNNLALLPRDMAKFGELYLRGGSWEGKQIIPRQWISESTSHQIVADHEVYGDYGYQWFVPRGQAFQGDFIAVGYGGQYIYVAPRIETVVVVTSTLESKGRDWEKRLFSVIQDDLLQVEGELLTSTGRPEEVLPVQVVAARNSSVPVPDENEILVALRLEKATWLEERQRHDEAVRELRARQRTTERSLAAAKATIDNLRRRESLHLSAAESDAAQAAQARAQKATEALAAKAELLAQLRASSETIAGQAAQLTSVGLELERSQAAEHRLVQQAKTDQSQTRASGEMAREELLRQFSIERRQLETELATEQARADQALRELERTRTLAQGSVLEKASAAEKSARVLERAVASEQALARRGQRLAIVQEEVEALRAETKGMRSELATARVAADGVQNLLRESRGEVADLSAQLVSTTVRETDRTARLEDVRKSLEKRLEASEGSRVALHEDLRKGRQDQALRVAELEKTLAAARTDLGRESQSAVVASDLQVARDAELTQLRETVKTGVTRLAQVERDRLRLGDIVRSAEGETGRLADSLLKVEAQLESARQELVTREQQSVTAQDVLQRQLQSAEQQALELGSANRELTQDLSTARASEAQAKALRLESEGTVADAQQGRDRERQDLMRRLDDRERSLEDLRRELTKSRDRTDVDSEAASLRKSYQQLLQESEMLARRSGEQAEKIAVLERRVRGGAGSGFQRRIRELLAEVDRMLGDRRVSGLVRRDLSRLRGALAELGKGKVGRA